MSHNVVLVTGANGYIASHIIALLISRGYKVRGAVRSESSGAKLREIYAHQGDQFSLTIVPDITKPEAYAEAFDGVTGVIHTASPFVLHVADNKKDLLDPAVQGAVAVLEAAKRYGQGKVRRIVSTSSFASIVDLSKGWRPGYTYSEKDWNPMSYDEASVADGTTAYCASKALAEEKMWAWFKENNETSFTLATICPPWVFGPHTPALASTAKLNESTGLLWSLFSSNEVPAFDFGGFVDVRNVAEAHAAALEKYEAGGERFLLGSHFDWQSAVDAARKSVPELDTKIPEGQPGKHLVSEVYSIDGSKAQRVLGIEYLTLEQCMKDSFSELIRAAGNEVSVSA